MVETDVTNSIEATITRYTVLLQRLLESRLFAFDGNLHGALPIRGGVYRIIENGIDQHNSVYIGKSSNLQNRIYRSHLMGNQQVSTLKRKLIGNGEYVDEQAVKSYLKERCSVQFVTIEDDAERTSFEHFAVAILKPRYND